MTRLHSLLAAAVVALALLGATAEVTDAQEISTTHPVAVACQNPPPGDPQRCEPPFTVTVATAGTLVVDFMASPTHCSDIRVRFLVDGSPVTDFSDPLNAGESTGEVDLGPVPLGTHALGVQAEGVLGGCNSGRLASWAGELDVITSLIVGPPTAKTQCRQGGWRAFNNPVFKNQGDCVSFVATGGRNPGQ